MRKATIYLGLSIAEYPILASHEYQVNMDKTAIREHNIVSAVIFSYVFNTASCENKEADGKGVFIEKLEKVLAEKNISISIIGIRTSKEDGALKDVKELLRL